MSGEKTSADRFNTAWQRFERYLNGRYPSDRRGGSGDSEAKIRRATADGAVTREQGEFIDACRRVRNAVTHVTFDEYDGPAATPPQPVVIRLERLVREIVDRVRLKDVAKPALTRRADDPLQDVLREMKEHDYTQVPYYLEGTGWVLLTRDQVARWVEDSAEENLAMVDLHTSIGELSEAVGPVVPTVLAADCYVVDALAHLERSDSDAYPAVIVDRGQKKPPAVLTAWDIPELYRRLGRLVSFPLIGMSADAAFNQPSSHNRSADRNRSVRLLPETEDKAERVHPAPSRSCAVSAHFNRRPGHNFSILNP